MFDPFGETELKRVGLLQGLAMVGIGVAVFTSPSSNMIEQAAGAIVVTTAGWMLAARIKDEGI